MLYLKIKLDKISDIKDFINETIKIKEDVDLIKGRLIVDAKSVMGLMSLDLSTPVEIAIHSTDIFLLEPFRKWEVK